MSKRALKLDPEFVVVWHGVQVWTLRAPDINAAARIAARVTGRPERELGIAQVPKVAP